MLSNSSTKHALLIIFVIALSSSFYLFEDNLRTSFAAKDLIREGEWAYANVQDNAYIWLPSIMAIAPPHSSGSASYTTSDIFKANIAGFGWSRSASISISLNPSTVNDKQIVIGYARYLWVKADIYHYHCEGLFCAIGIGYAYYYVATGGYLPKDHLLNPSLTVVEANPQDGLLHNLLPTNYIPTSMPLPGRIIGLNLRYEELDQSVFCSDQSYCLTITRNSNYQAGIDLSFKVFDIGFSFQAATGSTYSNTYTFAPGYDYYIDWKGPLDSGTTGAFILRPSNGGGGGCSTPATASTEPSNPNIDKICP